jgi:hypothetical protein
LLVGYVEGYVDKSCIFLLSWYRGKKFILTTFNVLASEKEMGGNGMALFQKHLFPQICRAETA